MADQDPQRRPDRLRLPFAIADPGIAAALVAGRKTQMRVLAHSPLAQTRPGDRVIVREPCIAGRYVEGKVYATALDRAEFMIFADGWRQHRDGSVERGRRPTDPDHLWLPALRMPSWAARMALLIDRVEAHPLRRIARADIRAEGAVPLLGGLLWRWPRPVPGVHPTARGAFARYWNIQHSARGERWEDDPLVATLHFRVMLGA